MSNGLMVPGFSTALGTLNTTKPAEGLALRFRLRTGLRTFRNREFYDGFACAFTRRFCRKLRLASPA